MRVAHLDVRTRRLDSDRKALQLDQILDMACNSLFIQFMEWPAAWLPWRRSMRCQSGPSNGASSASLLHTWPSKQKCFATWGPYLKGYGLSLRSSMYLGTKPAKKMTMTDAQGTRTQTFQVMICRIKLIVGWNHIDNLFTLEVVSPPVFVRSPSVGGWLPGGALGDDRRTARGI